MRRASRSESSHTLIITSFIISSCRLGRREHINTDLVVSGLHPEASQVCSSDPSDSPLRRRRPAGHTAIASRPDEHRASRRSCPYLPLPAYLLQENSKSPVPTIMIFCDAEDLLVEGGSMSDISSFF